MLANPNATRGVMKLLGKNNCFLPDNGTRLYTLTSGLLSNGYGNLAKIVQKSFDLHRLADLTGQNLPRVNFYTGPYTAGPFIAQMFAFKRLVDFIYPDKDSHDFSKGRCQVAPGKSIGVFDDMLTTGKTLIPFVQKLQDAGAVVEFIFVIGDRRADKTAELVPGIPLYSAAEFDWPIGTLEEMQMRFPNAEVLDKLQVKEFAKSYGS